jgi:hypothetical protein
VQISPTIIFRKTIASLLLALLVLVYAEKAFHTHAKENSHAEQAGVSIVSNNTGCSICDFTITKDTELPEPIAATVPFTFLNKEYSSASITYHFQTGNSTSDRGPPSF